MKRWTYWPQAWLGPSPESYSVIHALMQPSTGLAMNWGYIVAWAAAVDDISGNLQTISCFFLGTVW